MEKSKEYNFKEEEDIQKFWQDNEIYKFKQESSELNNLNNIYSVDTPPPTISGKMHIGHAFSYSHGDFIVRYQRMKGKNVFFPFGTDDNGLATERLIEKMHNVVSKKMDRQEFIKLCETTLEKLRKEFIADWKRLGISCDWNLLYSTIDDHSRRISQRSFIELYKNGVEYRKETPVMWCPHCQTAIAQVELEDKEKDSFFNDIIFKGDSKEDILIATTRPELLSSCVAIFVHPNDHRYKDNVGKRYNVPLFNQKVELRTDERVDMQKGTGAVMCCTFGDQTDIEWYKAYNLPLIVSITKDGRMTGKAGRYYGMKVKEAREEIISDLEKAGCLIKKTPIKHTVKTHERCSTEIEIINSKQWFIKYLDQKEALLKAGNELNWYPKFMKIRYDNWINGLQWDWCISRQRYFGVPFPVWYSKKTGEVILADMDQLPVDPLKDKPKKLPKDHTYDDIEPEKDVLDTWATSSLTPMLAIELIEDGHLRNKLYPMNLRQQAHDIITFWLFNTVVKSHFHYGVNPWKDVVISGFALDPHGKKMSKSKGNVISPQEMIDKYGADALRYWSSGTKLGEDLPFQEKDLVTGKKTVTKLWNAANFAFIHLKNYEFKKPDKLTVVDKWILTKLNNLIKESTDAFEKYEYSQARYSADHFFWHILCTYYLELVKYRLYNKEKYPKEMYESARYTLFRTFDVTLKIFSPIMPHITEKLYQSFFKKYDSKQSIHLTNWPTIREASDENSEKAGDLLIKIIDDVRKMKSENKLAMNKEIKSVVVSADDAEMFAELIEDLKQTVNAKEVQYKQGEFKVDIVV